MRAAAVLFAVATAFAAVAVSATTIVLPTDAQLIAASDVIVEGTVVRSTPVAVGRAIWTESVIAVETAYKGATTGQVVVRELGGSDGERFTRVFGAPRYTPGERVLAFLARTPHADYATLGLSAGKFTERHTQQGTRVWSRSIDVQEVTLLDQALTPIRGDAVRDASAFETFIDACVRGVDAPMSYGLPASAGRIASDFVTIDDPFVDRWFAFDEGKSVSWFSYGSQRGYASGGTAEIAAAMAPWNGCPQAKIRYEYAGPTRFAGSMRSQDGVNEIDFEDPAEEIAGSFGTSGGGVVAVGGVLGSASITRSWTAPFAADDAHPAGTVGAREIGEAFLIIQDGVSPEHGIDGTKLATIIAHELGHTLGLGHSSDPTAVMYAVVTKNEPTLSPDDERAARWLYPDVPVVDAGPLKAAFDVSSTSGAARATTFTFSDRSTGTPLTRTWRFGDGKLSNAVSPTHVYTATGTYVVTLTLTEGSTYSVATQVVTVVRPKAKRRAAGR